MPTSAHISILPVEILECAVSELPPNSLPTVLRLNKHFHAVALRVLYRTISELSLKPTIRLLQSLSRHNFSVGPRNPFSIIRTLHLDFSRCRVTANLLRLIQRVLRSLTSLSDLSLEFGLHDNHYSLAWFLQDDENNSDDNVGVSGASSSSSNLSEGRDGPHVGRGNTITNDETQTLSLSRSPSSSSSLSSPSSSNNNTTIVFNRINFRLRFFATSLRCDEQLARFLEKQTNLHELCLRGFQTTSPFVLTSSALPKLTSFRAVHAGSPVLEAVIKGRSIESVSISLFLEDCFAPLDTLRLSKREIKRLTIMSLDSTSPNVLIMEVVERLPNLEALHIVVLMGRYDEETLLAAAPCLASLKNLRYLTLMTGKAVDNSDESLVTRTWAKACPSLRTIILPQGNVWFERDGIWSCCA